MGAAVSGLNKDRVGAGAEGGTIGVTVKAAFMDDSVGVVDIISLPESGISGFSLIGLMFIGCG